ncbi:MAG: CBS domain-containing protein [Rhodovibrionaceae bacterium]|nr:CBS domain-containing protein [Rhodovibrionaceae bacterium]
MQIREIMSKDVQFLSPDNSLKEAAVAMRDGDFGVLPVGKDDRLVGMLTDRDIVVRSVAEGRDPGSTQVRDVMSDEVYYVFDDQSVDEAEQSMSEKRVRRLPVVDRDKRLVGIVSLGDMAVTSQSIRPAAQALADVSKHA